MADVNEASQNVEGTIVISSGTISGGTVQNVAAGTIQINPKSPKTLFLYGTLGTAGADTTGTLVTAGGVGTAHYIQQLSIVVHTGTTDCTIMYGTSQDGGSILARGNFPSGGGISKIFDESPGGNFTNNAVCYRLGGAGTASFNISYWTE